uniref:Uncharacterized protein n=1 Tax=Nostoc flagelliforme str. Sunitezuoqi TaxID=676037 RepID=E7DQ04_9NOSO|nr:hypothetical protein Nfla_6005 [Nostoc flagelliforme str. Sunitezuoqi]
MSAMNMQQQISSILQAYKFPVAVNRDWCIVKTMKEPTQEDTVEELSVDGGNKRDRTTEGEICAWLGYKAISLHHNGMVGTSFQDNQVVSTIRNSLFRPFAINAHG